MKKLLPFILISFGLLVLASAIFMRLSRERELLSKYIDDQQRNTLVGIQNAWQAKIIEYANQYKSLEYKILFDPVRHQIKDEFFPLVPPHLNWESYRLFTTDADRQKFLMSAIEIFQSWDRLLAIREWHRRYQSLPVNNLTDYEKSFIEPERAQAYERIFRCFNDESDSLNASSVYELRCALVRLLENGDLEIALPSEAQLNRDVLPAFLKSHQLVMAKINAPQIFELTNIALPRRYVTANSLELSLYVASILIVIGGVALSLYDMRNRARVLDQRVSFLNQIVHELRTPLAGLKLHTQLAKKHGIDTETLTAFEEGVSRMNELFEKILSVNRQQNVPLVAVTVEEFKNQVQKVVAEFPQCSLRDEAAQHGHVPINFDAFNIILKNLIRNGLSYGTHVNVVLTTDKDNLNILVVDNGPGISAEDAAHIFDSFYRGAQAHPDGLGLGLFISQSYAKKMGCGLRLVNPGHKNASFVISIPRKKT